jgi:hypothetical protein
MPKKMPTRAPEKRALIYGRTAQMPNSHESLHGAFQGVAAMGWAAGYNAALADMRRRLTSQ